MPLWPWPRGVKTKTTDVSYRYRRPQVNRPFLLFRSSVGTDHIKPNYKNPALSRKLLIFVWQGALPGERVVDEKKEKQQDKEATR